MKKEYFSDDQLRFLAKAWTDLDLRWCPELAARLRRIPTFLYIHSMVKYTRDQLQEAFGFSEIEAGQLAFVLGEHAIPLGRELDPDLTKELQERAYGPTKDRSRLSSKTVPP